MPEAVGGFEGPFNVAIPPAVTAVGDRSGDIAVYRPADHHIGNVAGSDPDDHEDAEDDVADGGEPEIFEAFGELSKH